MPARRLGRTAAVLIGTFLALAGWLQAARPDLDPWAMPLSAYLSGPGGGVLQAAYVALALGMVLLGIGLRRALVPAARSAAPVVLLTVGAVALVTTAFAVGASPLSAFVHGVAAQTAFLATATALPVQAWRFRLDGRWRRAAMPMLVWGLLAFAALWVHALVQVWPRGVTQKAVVLLIVGWLLAAAMRLWRKGRR